MANDVAIIETRAKQLAEKIEVLVTEARKKVASVVNTVQVYTYLSKIPDTDLEIRNHRLLNHNFVLSWSHYQILTHVRKEEMR